MRVTAYGSRERLLHGGAGLLETEALLEIIVQGDEADQGSLAELARLIDRGQLAGGGNRPENVALNADLHHRAIATLGLANDLVRLQDLDAGCRRVVSYRGA